jgi:hypothetical protein
MPNLEHLLFRTYQLLSGHDHAPNEFSFSVYAAEEEGKGDRIDCIFGCNKSQLLNWRVPDKPVGLWIKKCGDNLQIGMIKYESIGNNGRGWLRTANDGREARKSQFCGILSHQSTNELVVKKMDISNSISLQYYNMASKPQPCQLRFRKVLKLRWSD